MAVREIKTTLAVDGEQKFKRAINEAGRNMRVMASEMKAAAADFNLTGDEMEYLGRKSKSLNSQIAQQKEIIRALEEAIAGAAGTTRENSAAIDDFRIKLNYANANLSKMSKELEDNDRQMMELGRDAQRAGRQLEQGLGEAAEDTARKFDKMVNELDKDIIDIKGAVQFSALADIGDMLSGGVDVVVNAVSGLTEGTLDYRRQMAILEQNAVDMGFDPDWLKQQAAGIAALTGDMDGAVEAVSNMARVAPDVDSFTRVMNRLLGATIAWPETFKIENLAESLQESLASGQITGAYSELMSRLGLDIKTINKSFEEAAKKGSDALWTAGTAWTSEHGFEETLEAFKKANEDLLAYNQAKIDLTNAEAALAEKLTPTATAGIELFTGMIDKLTALVTKLGEEKDKWETAVEEGLFEENEVVTEAKEQNLPTWDEFAPGYDTGANEAGKAAGAGFIDGVGEQITLDGPGLPTWDDFAPGYDTSAKEDGKAAGSAVIGGADEQMQADAKNLPTWDDFAPGYDTGAKKDGKAAGAAVIGGIDEQMKADALRLPSWDEFASGYETGLLSDSKTAGSNIAIEMGNGVNEEATYAVSAVSQMMTDIQAELNKELTAPRIPGVGVGATNYGGQSTTGNAGSSYGAATITLDGKTVGEGMVDYNSSAAGKKIERASTYLYGG